MRHDGPPKPLRAAALLALSLLAGCTITFEGSNDHERFSTGKDQGRVLLAEGTGEDGVHRAFRLVRTSDEDVAVISEETRGVELPYLGVRHVSVGAQVAAQRGLTPWRGVILSTVQEGSAAEAAGLVAGDVVLAVEGTEVTSQEQFSEALANVQPGQALRLTVSSRVADGEGREERAVEATMGSRIVDEAASTRVPLTPAPVLMERAGLELVTLPEDLARQIHGGEGPRALVTAVWLGGPAYREGLRRGDALESANGRPLPTAEELVELVAGGAGRLDLAVRGPLGPHEASLELTDDVTASSDFKIPILVDHSSRVGRSSTSVLDFIFQFGWNHRRRALPSDTREARSSSYLSILPFGMFEFTRRPGVSKNRIFWFITWGGES